MPDQTILLVPDLHFGSEDRAYVKNITKLIADLQPDRVVQLGDLYDGKAPARWSRGSAEEFAGTLQAELDRAQNWLADVRSVYDGPLDILSGNHGARTRRYLERHAPALAVLRALDIRELLNLRYYEATWHEAPIKIAPGWLAAHGDEGRLAQTGGLTALGLAKKFGASVACGHTHRAGLVAETAMVNGRGKTLYGLECGHGMDIRKADYLSALSANWQKACGILSVSGGHVSPRLLYWIGGRFA